MGVTDRFAVDRFITSNWLVGVEAGITGINSDKDYRVGVFGEYNFLTGTKWVPFVRGGVGYLHPDQGDDSATLGLDAAAICGGEPSQS